MPFIPPTRFKLALLCVTTSLHLKRKKVKMIEFGDAMPEKKKNGGNKPSFNNQSLMVKGISSHEMVAFVNLKSH